MPNSTSLPSLRVRAIQTLDDIERIYSLGNGDYRQEAGKNAASFAWGHGVLASAYIAAAENIDAKKYLPYARKHLDALNRGYFRKEGPVPGYNASRNQSGGTDRYYDDNIWFALAWADAARLTSDPAFAKSARLAYDFAISGHPKGGGVLWHENNKNSYNTCSTAPTAVYALETARDTQTTRELYAWLRTVVLDPSDGLYWDNLSIKRDTVEKAKWSYNSALVLRLETSLAETWRTTEYLKRANALADACVARWYKPDMGLLNDGAMFAHLLGENLLRTGKLTGNNAAINAALQSCDTVWTKLRRPDGTYPKDWTTSPDRLASDKAAELISIASAARAYAYAIPYADWFAV